MRFTLTCDCGKQVIVTAAMAGETIRCACKKKIEIPSLRELRVQHPEGQVAPNNSVAPVKMSVWKIALLLLIGLWVFGYIFPFILRVMFR